MQSSPLQLVVILLHSKCLQVWEDYFCSAFVKTVQKYPKQVALASSAAQLVGRRGHLCLPPLLLEEFSIAAFLAVNVSPFPCQGSIIRALH